MSTPESDVPDSIRPYLNEIAERLWATRAAVMVGAGFSKNAGDGFPDWNQLGDLFYQKAHGVKPDSTRQKYLNVLRLAEEVQAAIGRPALENLLRSNIPDLTIEPSDLHVELLELPWVDVLTTNYDTLLERATAKVVARRYEPVVNEEDIPYAIKPRIVKLHGSFPSERPFIITEEDYRRYPQDYAPFVNAVQQALLENTFCLIGFSGDDPNFLQWIGWIRDNLGKDKTQKLYLVGVFDMSSARLQLLAQRGIIVVDLSCCHGIEKHDHKKALTKFFEYMRSKKPDALDWPPNPTMIAPAHGTDRIAEFQRITEEWRRQRHSYPGWLTLPQENRERLWEFTASWISYLPNIEELPTGLDIEYSFELIWRLERCLLPIFDNIAEFCEVLLERYWPFQNVIFPANCQFRAGEENFRDLPWDHLRQAWLAIALAMIRFYREEGNFDKWTQAESKLKTLSDHLSAEQKEYLNYEGFLFSLFMLDLPNAKHRLENWRSNEAQPYWMAKRAAALAEIGLLNEAETIIRDALENIRKKLNQRIGATDFTLFSLESNAMLLGKYVQDAAAIQRNEWRSIQDNKTPSHDRWNDLKEFKCDPWNELKIFNLTLKTPSVPRNEVTEKREFDIGLITKTRHFSSTDKEGLSAYAFLRFCEDVGLPFRVGNCSMATETAVASLQRISRYSSFWAIATLFRLGDTKAVENLFDRESVYKFTADESDQLIKNYLDALNKCRDDIHTGDAFRNENYGVRLAQLLPEVISRLCCKCSCEAKHRVLEFITGIYDSPDKTNYRNVGNLTKRLMKSMTEVERYTLIPELLKIPFPGDLSVFSKKEFPNPFSLLDLNQKPECEIDLEIEPGLVDNLCRHAALNNSDRRRWSITSLETLHKFHLLDDDQTEKLADAIWGLIDHHRLPDSTDFYKFVFLHLPHPEDVAPPYLFKNYVKATPFPIQKIKDDGGVNITGGNIPLVREILGANSNGSIWTEEDAVDILLHLIEWWDSDKDRLSEKENVPAGFFSIQDEFRSRFSCIAELLAEVVGPKLGEDSPDDIKTSLGRLLREMREYQIPILEAEVVCLHIYPEQKAVAYERINEALISNQNKIERDGLRAIAKIILGSIDTEAGLLEHDPSLMLSQYLTWRPTCSIAQALWIVALILKNSPTRFSPRLEVTIKRRLERLITETAYDKKNPWLAFDEKLEVRRSSSFLAAALWTHYTSRGLSVPWVVERWRETCLSPDEFSEVRNAWKGCESLTQK